jgi:predicted FMN-binding regulatory protein PaiB
LARGRRRIGRDLLWPTDLHFASFYPTKAETGKVVPTWNYEVLNVYGRLAVHDDPDWVRHLVTMLTNHPEPPDRAVAGQRCA